MTDEQDADRTLKFAHDWREEDFIVLTEGLCCRPTPYSGEPIIFEVELEDGKRIRYEIDTKTVELVLVPDIERSKPKLYFWSSMAGTRVDAGVERGKRKLRRRRFAGFVELYADGTGQFTRPSRLA